MAQKESFVNVSEKTERERMVIAKEVIIKTLVPAVFENVTGDEKRKQVFAEWYQELYKLIIGTAAPAPQPKPAPQAAKKVVRMQEDKATDKQIKMMFALARKMGWRKEDIEKEAQKTHLPSISHLTKSQASKLIDGMLAIQGMNEIYG